MTSLHSLEIGTGETVILLHGFPFNQQLWAGFAKKLGDSHRVVTLDLPGFGNSPALPSGFTIDDVSSEILSFIQTKGYEAPVIVGHSLGGYIALGMAERDPGAMAGLCLFHSTAMADSSEKRQSRNKTLDFIARQGVRAFTSNFVAQLYADQQHSSITRVKNIAVQASREAVEGYTLAMRDRPDRQSVLKSFQKPILIIAGEKDPGIPVSAIQEQASLNPAIELSILPDTGHMGMFEAESVCVKKISEFVRKSAVTFRA